jgi:rubrerythrin
MAVITIADVLRRAEEFEGRLAAYYKRLSEHTTREGVQMLTDYMSRHRVRIGERLDKLSPDEVRRICSTPLRYEPQAADCRCFEGIDLPPDATSAQVLDTAVTLDECLVNLYRQVVQQPVDEEVRELFESLIRTEERDEIELKKIKAMDYF